MADGRLLGRYLSTESSRSARALDGINVANGERLASIVAGSALVGTGILKRSVAGIGMAALGIALIMRGKTGHCNLYSALGISTADDQRNQDAAVPYGHGIRVEESVIINRPPEELYAIWRDLRNLSSFMEHLQEVSIIDSTTSHWVAKGPAGTLVEWDARIISDREPDMISWRSVEGSTVNHAGSVHFRQWPDGLGTEVQVLMEYTPPAGKLGAAVAKLLGEDPARQIKQDLERLKVLVESGQVSASR